MPYISRTPKPPYYTVVFMWGILAETLSRHGVGYNVLRYIFFGAARVGGHTAQTVGEERLAARAAEGQG